MLKGKKIVVGISGGIAAYKACELVRLIKKAEGEVRVVMTENAKKFVTAQTFETLSQNPVAVDCFEHSYEIEHISLAKFADLCVVAPATANIIAKYRSGIADDMLSTALCAMKCPVLIAPAMNTAMWENPANAENIKVLSERGCFFAGPESGMLACGDADKGRMSEPQVIFDKICGLLKPNQDLKGLKLLVTAGPTREMLDPVRFLSNRSTGKMGFAISEQAQKRGAEVTLVTGPVSLDTPNGVNRVDIISTGDLYNEVTTRAQTADIVIQAAAPADFTVRHFSEQKIKKDGTGMTLELDPTPDIAKTIGERKQPSQVLVAFAAETDADKEKADAKRKRKNADIIVLNDVTKPGAGFAGDTNIVTLISDKGALEYPVMSKREVADRILDAAKEIFDALR